MRSLDSCDPVGPGKQVGVKDFGESRSRYQIALKHQLVDAAASGMSLDRDRGGHRVADVRIESCDKANRVLDVSPKLVPVSGDADDAAFFECQKSFAEVTDALRSEERRVGKECRSR